MPLETYVILKHELFYFKGHWEMKTEGIEPPVFAVADVSPKF